VLGGSFHGGETFFLVNLGGSNFFPGKIRGGQTVFLVNLGGAKMFSEEILARGRTFSHEKCTIST